MSRRPRRSRSSSSSSSSSPSSPSAHGDGDAWHDALAQAAQAAKAYEAAHVLPHCPTCTRPCCSLVDVVLDLSWPQAQTLYRIGSSQRSFDASLRDGSGPAHIRKQGATYYAHGAACPAYDDDTKRCRVYATDVKPRSCSDFPIYVDGDAITADARCEAVDIDVVHKHLAEALAAHAADVELARMPDRDFPELVSFVVRRRAARRR